MKKLAIIIAAIYMSSCADETIDNPYLLRYDAMGKCGNLNPGLQAPEEVTGPKRIRFKEKEKKLIQSGLSGLALACEKEEVDSNPFPLDIHSLTKSGFKALGFSGTFTKTKKIETNCGEVQLYNLRLDPSAMAIDEYTGSYDCK